VPRIGKAVIHAGLETLYFTGGYRLARHFLAGAGAILTFHHVRPPRPDAFQPNRSLEIAPEFLDEILTRLQEADVDIISLDAAHERIITGCLDRRFVVLTFDDGYRDNRIYALPILRRHNAPATFYLPSSFADGIGALWWVELERAIARQDSIALNMGGEVRRFDTSTDAGKEEAFSTIYWWLRTLPDESEMRRICRDLAIAAGVEAEAICRELCMGWDEIAELAADPLITIGSHTDSHIMLAKAPDGVVREEMAIGAKKIEERLGIRPAHFSYPVGDPGSAGPREFAIARELGFLTGVTTRPGVLFPDHRDHLASLPRISVNGDFQRFRHLDVLLSGAPTALLNRFRRVDAA
jgi:peptidoglycan/xylan/chitin deacetylase (PgdA/CDA1 family)